MDFIKGNIKIVISIITVICMVVGGAVAYRHYYPTGVIQTLIDRETTILKEQYEQDLAARDKEIEVAQSLLKKSQVQVTQLNSKIKKLEGIIKDVQAPKTLQETKDRFRALGFTPSR